jgi:guanine deaminase
MTSRFGTVQPTQFLLPGFIDTHLHAPQYSYAGTATDTPLMEWLNKVAEEGTL